MTAKIRPSIVTEESPKRNGWGGARSNSGGANGNAGRPAAPKPIPVKIAKGVDMLTVLQEIALGMHDVTPLQVRAAVAAVSYTHVKTAYGGNKARDAKKAQKVLEGKYGSQEAPPVTPKFTSSAPPAPLKVVGGNE